MFLYAPGAAAEPSPWLDEDATEAALADTLSASVVYLENDSNEKYITGTLVYSSSTLVLTNYHFLSSSTDVVHVSLNTAANTIEKFRCVFVKGDRKHDLAAFRIILDEKQLSELVAGGFVSRDTHRLTLPYTNRYLTRSSFARPSSVRRGCTIVFLGFPLNYGITVEKATRKLIKKPVFRSGKIASEVFNDEFLIDAMVSNGNSGSPVFIRSVTSRRGASHPCYKLIGIMKEFQHDTVTVDLEADGRVNIPHNAGLGIVIPVDIIETFIRDIDAGK
jgi:S1-C subfamily serine protease